MSDSLSHVDKKNNPTMVDVADKEITQRFAHAQSIVELPQIVLNLFNDGEIVSKKGPVFQTAIIAGTQAVKRTHELIPFCHSLNLEGIKLDISIENKKVVINCMVNLSGKTGVEMEALMGASIAALTIYDMCKAMGHGITIEKTYLIKKTGGKSDYQKSLS